MRCALVLLSYAALVGFSVLQVSGAPGSTVVPSHGSPANLAGFEKVKSVSRRRWPADVGIANAISEPGALARRHLQASEVKRGLRVQPLAGGRLPLWPVPPRPCAPAYSLKLLPRLECAYGL